MLAKVRLKNFRSFADTGEIVFGKINIFVGANNAGKSSVLGAVELLLRSAARPGGSSSPLALESLPSFASFESILRRKWSKKAARANHISIESEWLLAGEPTADGKLRVETPYWADFTLKARGHDGAAYVSELKFGRPGVRDIPVVDVVDSSGNHHEGSTYLANPNSKRIGFFSGILPYVQLDDRKKMGPDASAFLNSNFTGRRINLSVIAPQRPEPRSLYVMDDPNVPAELRGVLSALIRVWTGRDRRDDIARRRIVDNLRTLGVAKYFDVKAHAFAGPRLTEIRVSTHTKREFVTIADVGFGMSQVLPLISRDALLVHGHLIAYQPELHLHPFAQSRLADVFMRSAGRGNCLYIETHSTNLILRLQALVASGESGIDAKDIRVFCVENKSGESQIRPMAFDEMGRPLTPWPAGFVDTSLQLAKELAEARLSKREPA